MANLEALRTNAEGFISKISLTEPLITSIRKNKEGIYLAAMLAALPVTIWVLGQNDIQLQRMLPRILIAEGAAMVISVPAAYLSVRTMRKELQGENNIDPSKNIPE